jgi:hypothetical protein
MKNVLWLSMLALALCACGDTPPPPAAFPEAPFAKIVSQREGLRLDVRTAPTQPPVRGANTIELRVVDGRGAPLDGLAITVTPFMVAHGHASRAAGPATALGDGRYRVDDVMLGMAGDWTLRIAMTGAGGESRDDATLSVEVE